MKNILNHKLKQRFVLGQAVVFLFLLVLTFGCKDDNLLGIELQPEGQYDTLATTDSFLINAFTVLGERQRSDEAQSFIGRLQTPEFGSSESALILNFGFNAAYAQLDAINYTVDSVVLHVRPNRVYGAPTSSVPMEVFKLSEFVAADDDNYSDYAPTYAEPAIGAWNMTFPGQISVKDSVSINGVNEAFQFTARLDDAIGVELLELLKTEGVDDNKSFLQAFEGVILKPAAGMDPSQTGAIYSLALRTGESGLRLYLSDTAGVQEILKYPINSQCARVNQFTHDYTGSLAQSYLDSDSKREDLLFVQGLSGLKTELHIPGLYNLGADSRIAVSKALLTFKLAQEQPIDLSRSVQLFLLDLEADGTESLTPDYIYSRQRSGGEYDPELHGYEFDITRHVQRVVSEANKGNDVNYGLRLHAQVPVLNGNDTSHNVIQGLDNIVLKLYHTDLKN